VWLVAAVATVTISVIASEGTSAHNRRHSSVPHRHTAGAGATLLPGTPRVTIGAPLRRTVPPGFIGLSVEFPAIQTYAERDPTVFEQLVRNLAPGQAPVLKIGGDSTDWAWWPVPGMARPPGIRYALGPRWIRATRLIAGGLSARLILGIDLEANSATVASTEARALIKGVGAARIAALELGNEPELYPSWGWYRKADGREVPGRPAGYDFRAYTRNFASIASSLPSTALAGPAIGAPGWMRHVGQFIASEPRLSFVTLHRYPLQRCFMPAASPLYPTIHNLLSPEASQGLAQSVVPYVTLAHAHGLRLRVDELNSVSCGGAAGVSNTFASALWALDAAFEMARVGVDGVNVHTFPGAAYQLFSFRRRRGTWTARVFPEYYGLMMFAEAALPGSRLLESSAAGRAGVKVWATRARDGSTRIVLINDAASRARLIRVRLAGPAERATLKRLTAPGLRARTGVTIGGQTFGAHTANGMLAGRQDLISVVPVEGEYVVRLPATSAALLTVP
jgi:hypothetical protein